MSSPDLVITVCAKQTAIHSINFTLSLSLSCAPPFRKQHFHSSVIPRGEIQMKSQGKGLELSPLLGRSDNPAACYIKVGPAPSGTKTGLSISTAGKYDLFLHRSVVLSF